MTTNNEMHNFKKMLAESIFSSYLLISHKCNKINTIESKQNIFLIHLTDGLNQLLVVFKSLTKKEMFTDLRAK